MHRNNFDAMRLVAASLVMISHQFALLGLPEPRPIAGLTLGTYAVFVFFAISGFLIAKSWDSDPNVRRFTARRMLRIAPAYIVVISLTQAAMLLSGQDSFSMNPVPHINGSLWTIPIEVQCYLAFMALAAVFRHGALALAALALLLGTEGFFKQFLGIFALGALLGAYPILRKPWATCALIGLGLLLIPPLKLYYAIVLILVPLTVALGSASWPFVRSAGRYGDISYGVYLTAYPVQQFAIMFLGSDKSYLLLFGISAAITAALAYCSWRLIESPALQLKSGLRREPIEARVVKHLQTENPAA